MASKTLAFILLSCISAVLVLLALPALDIHIFKKSHGEKCYVNSECFEDLGLSCIGIRANHYTCQCSDSNYWEEKKERCIGKKTNLMACHSSLQCLDGQGLSCIDSVCQCSAPDSYFDVKYEYCLPKKSNGGSCHSNENCLINKGLSCDGRIQQCACSDHMFWNNNTYKCTEKRSHAEQCLADNDCQQGLFCSASNVCECSDNKVWNEGQCNFAHKTENEACEQTSDCVPDKGLECIENFCLCADRKKFFLPTSECTYGINNNVSTSELFEAGYSLIYNQPMKHKTVASEIMDIRSNCQDSSILCLAGANNEGKNLVVVACGNCLAITSVTEPEQPKQNGDAYWYFTPEYSIGFAPNANVKQVKADPLEEEGDLRLSWHLTGDEGGWRAGSMRFLADSTDVLKYAFIKH